MKEYSNLKKFLVALIPFAWSLPKLSEIVFSKYIGIKIGDDQKMDVKTKLVYGLNWLITTFLVLSVVLYIMASDSQGSLNYKKWPEIKKQHQTERLNFEQNVIDKAFAQLAGADSLISKTEFKNFLEQNTSEKYNDLYSEFNRWLKLDEEHVEFVYRKK